MGPVGAAAQIGGQIYGAISGYQAGKAEEKMMDYNIGLKEQEAKQIEAVTGLKQAKQAEEAGRLQSSMEAGLAAGGAVSTTGTGLLAQARQAAESELQNLYIGYEGATQAGKARSEAGIMKMEKAIHRQQRRTKFAGDLIGAGGTALTGFAQYSSPKTTGPTPQSLGLTNPNWYQSGSPYTGK